MTVLVIAEAGVNHNGDLDRAIEMVRTAADAGADYVKFQAFRTADIVTESSPAAAYQSDNTGETKQSALLAGLELDLDAFEAIAKACDTCGIGFLCTPFEMSLVKPLLDMGMDRIKIPSGEITNEPMLERYGSLGYPVILSTGMSTLPEVMRAVELLNGAGCEDLTILHCTSLYPAPAEKLNLNAISTLREATGLPVGYSDHSLGDHAAIAAVALGAVMIEKHFTLDRTLPGPDHKASILPSELGAMIEKLREVHAMMGDGEKKPMPGELETAALVRRSWHAVRDLDKGMVISSHDVALKRPAHGLPPSRSPVGMKLKNHVKADEVLLEPDLTKGR